MITIHHFAARHGRETKVIGAVLVLPCGLACAGPVVSGLNDIVSSVLAFLVALALLGLAGRSVMRTVRERGNDGADALPVARSRVMHLPRLLTTAHRAHLGIRSTVTVSDFMAAA